MAEDSGTEPELQECAVKYLASLGTTPDELRRHYPNTYRALASLSCDQIDGLDTLGAGLAQDDPKGDNHKDAYDADVDDADADDADADDADESLDAGDKLKKYLFVIH